MYARLHWSQRWPKKKPKKIGRMVIAGLMKLGMGRDRAKQHSQLAQRLVSLYQQRRDIPGLPSGHWNMLSDPLSTNAATGIDEMLEVIKQHIPNASFSSIDEAVREMVRGDKSNETEYNASELELEEITPTNSEGTV